MSRFAFSPILSSDKSKLEAQHELNLARQPCAVVRGRGMVIVVIEIVRRGNLTKISGGQECVLVRYRVPLAVCRLSVVKSQVVAAGISQLDVVQNVKHLHAELRGNPLSDLDVFHECDINLPGVKSSDETVRSVAKSTYETIGGSGRIERRRGKRGRIDRDRVILHSTG